MHRLALCLVFIASTLAAPRPAAAAANDVYDSIDAAEVIQHDSNFSGAPTLTLRGILSGAGTPSTKTYFFNASASSSVEGIETAMHCQRLALLVMSKPGKFQLGIGHPTVANFATGCKLTRVAP